MIKLLTTFSLCAGLSLVPKNANETTEPIFSASIPLARLCSGSDAYFLNSAFGIVPYINENDNIENFTPAIGFTGLLQFSDKYTFSVTRPIVFQNYDFESYGFSIDSFDKSLKYFDFTITPSISMPARTFQIVVNVKYVFEDESTYNYSYSSLSALGSNYIFPGTMNFSAFNVYSTTYRIYLSHLYDTYNMGFENGLDEGFQSGLEADTNTQTFLDNVWTFVENATNSVFRLLDFQILPGIPLYSIILIPLCVCILFIVMKWLGE